jgi:CRISPR type I-E-associated protein CasB/Cse2
MSGQSVDASGGGKGAKLKDATGVKTWAERAVTWFEETSSRRADFAKLRRCSTPDEAACEEVVFGLALKLRAGSGGVTEHDLRRAGLVAGVLAGVRMDAKGRSLGSMLGETQAKGGAPRFSRLRFRALLDAREPQEAMSAFRRAVAILDGNAPVLSLAERLLDWTSERPHPSDPSGRRTRADEARVRLTREYYEASLG